MKCFTRFVPFDLAKRLTEVGFEETTLTMYGPSGEFCFGGENPAPAPIFAEALDWFLFDHGIHISIVYARNLKYHVLVQTVGDCCSFETLQEYDDVYLALLDSCNTAIDIIANGAVL